MFKLGIILSREIISRRILQRNRQRLIKHNTMNLLINGGFTFTVLDTITREPIVGGLQVIHNALREGKFTIDFKSSTILNMGVPIFHFTIEPNKGTEFRFQF